MQVLCLAWRRRPGPWLRIQRIILDEPGNGPGRGANMEAVVTVLAVSSNFTLINIFAVAVVTVAGVMSAIALRRK